MNQFEEILKTLPEYKTLLMQHGERLFIKRDGEYEILAVRLAYKFHDSMTMTCVVVKDDGVLTPEMLNDSGKRSVIVADYDLFVPIQGR